MNVQHCNPQFIEGLTFAVDPQQVDAYIQVEEDIWLAGLSATPGFLGGEVWVSADRPGEVTTFYFWESETHFKSIDPQWLQGRKEASMQAFEATFVRAWHSDERRHRVKIMTP